MLTAHNRPVLGSNPSGRTIYNEDEVKKRISPEDDKSIDWVPVDNKMLKEWYEAKLAKKNKTLTFNNGYGMLVTYRYRKKK